MVNQLSARETSDSVLLIKKTKPAFVFFLKKKTKPNFVILQLFYLNFAHLLAIQLF